MGTTTNERVERFANNMRLHATACQGFGPEVWALGFLRSYINCEDAGAAVADVLAALDIVNKEKEAE